MEPPAIGPEQRRQHERYQRLRETLHPARRVLLVKPRAERRPALPVCSPGLAAHIAAVTAEDFGADMPMAEALGLGGAPTFSDAVREVTAYHGVTVAELLGAGRMRYLMSARHELYWLAVVEYGLSLPAAGRALGGKDHTTIMHGKRRIDAVFAAAFGVSGGAALGVPASARHEAVRLAYRSAEQVRSEVDARNLQGARR